MDRLSKYSHFLPYGTQAVLAAGNSSVMADSVQDKAREHEHNTFSFALPGNYRITPAEQDYAPFDRVIAAINHERKVKWDCMQVIVNPARRNVPMHASWTAWNDKLHSTAAHTVPGPAKSIPRVRGNRYPLRAIPDSATGHGLLHFHRAHLSALHGHFHSALISITCVGDPAGT